MLVAHIDSEPLATCGTPQSAQVRRPSTSTSSKQTGNKLLACQSLQADVFVCVGVLGAPTGTPTAIPTRTTTTTTTTKPSPPATPRPCRWNSSKGQYDCPGVWPPAPGPTQEGVPYDCMKWVIQKDGIYCAEMAKAAGITLARFYTLNPGVGTSCGGLWLGYAYCVATE